MKFSSDAVLAMHIFISTLVCFEQEADNQVKTVAVAVIDLDGLKKIDHRNAHIPRGARLGEFYCPLV
ncbi:MAG: hypothetical protein ACI9ZF_003727 [Bradyrhizobium sp.]